jgi:hypothetical protein
MNCFLSSGDGIICGLNRPRRPFRTYLQVTLHGSGKLTTCRGCIGNTGRLPTLGIGRATSLGPFRCTALKGGVRCVVTNTGRGFSFSGGRLKRV